MGLLKPAPTTTLENHPLPQEPTITPIEPEEMLDIDIKTLRGGKKIVHYLVKWKGLDSSEATWETRDVLEGYPHLSIQLDYIEDNVHFGEGESYSNPMD